MIKRYEIINHFTSKFSFCRYLEIGSCNRDNFNRIRAAIKHDVEPYPQGIKPEFQCKSDEFFRNNKYQIFYSNQIISKRIYDVIFIDGLHHYEQVLRDVRSASDMLVKNGVIIIHDCLPEKEIQQERIQQSEGWMGDVWKAQAFLCQFPNVYTVKNSDCGCGIILGNVNYNMPEKLTFGWIDFNQEHMNLIEWDKLKNIVF